MELYSLRIVVEELKDDGDYRYVASSPDLPNLIVAGDSPDEVLSLAPRVASTLIASMKAAGDKLPSTLQFIQSLPFTTHTAIAV